MAYFIEGKTDISAVRKGCTQLCGEKKATKHILLRDRAANADNLPCN